MDVHWTSTQATKESQFRFFLELTKKYQVCILPTSETVFFLKHQFWCVLRHQSHTWSLVSEDLFWSLQAVLLKEAKRLYFFVTIEFFVSITFATKLVHKKKKKKNEASTHCCFWKTNLKMTVERRQNHLRQSQLIFQKTFRTLRKNEEISKIVYFFSFGLKLKMKLVETVSVTIMLSLGKLFMLQRQIKNSQKNLLFVVDWGL